jgi:hypothetical protein
VAGHGVRKVMRLAPVLAAFAVAAAPSGPAHAEPTPSPSSSPSPFPHSCPPYQTVTLDVRTPTIQAGAAGVVRLHGERSDTVTLYEKQAQNTGYVFRARYAFDGPTDVDVRVTPRTNADYKLAYSGGGPSRDADRPEGCKVPYYDGETSPKRMGVATTLTLGTAVRAAVRSYVFSGTNKGHAGDLVNLYRVDASGHPVLTAQAEAGTDGTYRVRRTFSGTGTFTFFTGSPADRANLAGQSNRLQVQIR